MMRLLGRCRGGEDVHRSIERRAEWKSTGLMVLAAVGACVGVGGFFGASSLWGNLAGGGLLLTAAVLADELLDAPAAQQAEHKRVRAWEQAIETGAPDRSPLCESTEIRPNTAAVKAYRSVRQLAEDIGQAVAIREVPGALVVAGTRLRKRS